MTGKPIYAWLTSYTEQLIFNYLSALSKIGIANMKTIFLQSLVAFCIGIFGAAGDLAAKPISKKQQAEAACEKAFQDCFNKCDKAPNTTPTEYKTCGALCAHEYYHCSPYYSRTNQALPKIIKRMVR